MTLFDPQSWEKARYATDQVLPKVAPAAADIGGVLVGGTALAWHLRHRPSFDLDVLADGDFDEALLADRLASVADTFEVLTKAPSLLAALVDGVKIQVWKSAAPQVAVEIGPVVSGMQIASLPDLFALKLRAVRGRAALRDYVDIAALIEKAMTLEDGLRAYGMRFGVFLVYDDLRDMFSVLTPPPKDLPSDPLCDDIAPLALDTVHQAAIRALQWITGRDCDSELPGQAPELPRSSGPQEDSMRP